MAEETTTQTSDAVLDAEQTEEVTAFLADAIKEFLEETYTESEKLSTYHINQDLQDHGRDYAIGQLYELAESHPVDPNAVDEMSWLKLWLELPEDTDQEEEFSELLRDLYFKALERVSWHVAIVVSVK
jgi:hypothetical protein